MTTFWASFCGSAVALFSIGFLGAIVRRIGDSLAQQRNTEESLQHFLAEREIGR
jgi:hypothetical protein